MTNTYQTVLPIFSGFYGGNFEVDTELILNSLNDDRYDLNKAALVNPYLEIDYDKFHNDISKRFCEKIETLIHDNIDENCKITFENLVSPRYYNYQNDVIDISINIDLTKVIGLINENFESFQTYIKERYTAYDGFIPAYSNDANNWLKNEFIEEKSKHCVSVFLDFLLSNVYECDEAQISDEIKYNGDHYFDSVEYCINYMELVNYNLLSESFLKFDSINDFDECLTFLNTFYNKTNYFFDRDLLKITFNDDIEKELLNDLENNSLVNFKFSLEY